MVVTGKDLNRSPARMISFTGLTQLQKEGTVDIATPCS
jgi:hypothetical protein